MLKLGKAKIQNLNRTNQNCDIVQTVCTHFTEKTSESIKWFAM